MLSNACTGTSNANTERMDMHGAGHHHQKCLPETPWRGSWGPIWKQAWQAFALLGLLSHFLRMLLHCLTDRFITRCAVSKSIASWDPPHLTKVFNGLATYSAQMITFGRLFPILRKYFSVGLSHNAFLAVHPSWPLTYPGLCSSTCFTFRLHCPGHCFHISSQLVSDLGGQATLYLSLQSHNS